MFGGTCLAWSSKKQSIVALSTTEAEYIALTHAAKQMVWIRLLLSELGLPQQAPTNIRSDNLGAITLAQDATYHARTKHIKIYYHFVREKVATQEAVITYVPTEENIADILTKALTTSPHQYLTKKLGIYVDISLRRSVASVSGREAEAPARD